MKHIYSKLKKSNGKEINQTERLIDFGTKFLVTIFIFISGITLGLAFIEQTRNRGISLADDSTFTEVWEQDIDLPNSGTIEKHILDIGNNQYVNIGFESGKITFSKFDLKGNILLPDTVIFNHTTDEIDAIFDGTNIFLGWHNEIGNMYELQKLNLNGDPLWSEPSIEINSSSLPYHNLISDENGGIYVIWVDHTNDNVMLQQLDSSGNMLLGANGLILYSGTAVYPNTAAVGDGNGNIYTLWRDDAQLYLQLFDESGNNVWINPLSINTMSSTLVANINLAVDQNSNVMVVWEELTPDGGPPEDPDNRDVAVQYIDSSGSFVWSPTPLLLTSTTNRETNLKLVNTQDDNFIVAWESRPNASNQLGDIDIYAQKIDLLGNEVWTAGGVLITDQGNATQTALEIFEESNGIVASWSHVAEGDQYNYPSNFYTQKLDSNGSKLWGNNGINISTSPINGEQTSKIVSDGFGGAIIGWSYGTVNIQRINEVQGTLSSGSQKRNDTGASIITGSWINQGNITLSATYNYTEIKTHEIEIEVKELGQDFTDVPDNLSGTLNSGDIYDYAASYATDKQYHWQYRACDSKDICTVWTSYGSNSESEADFGVDATPPVSDDTKLIYWTVNGISVVNDPQTYTYKLADIIYDGDNGAIIVYQNTSFAYNYAQRFDTNGSRLWNINGVTVTADSTSYYLPSSISNGNNGVVIVNNDEIIGMDISASQLNSSGSLTALTNITTDAADDKSPAILNSGTNQWIIAWHKNTNDLYTQKINNLSNGKFWNSGTNIQIVNSVDASGGYDDFYTMTNDSDSGVIFAWEDTRSGHDIYVQRLDDNGSMLWTPGGINISNSIEADYRPQIISDGQGGAYIIWINDNNDIFAQRIDSNGSEVWTTDKLIVDGNLIATTLYKVTSSSDSGAIISWSDDNGSGHEDIFAQKLDLNGNLLWNSEGIVIVNASNDQHINDLEGNSTGGAFFVWRDYRDGKWDIYTQSVDNDGTIQYLQNGQVIYNVPSGNADDPMIALVSDQNEQIIAWNDNASPSNIRAQKISQRSIGNIEYFLNSNAIEIQMYPGTDSESGIVSSSSILQKSVRSYDGSTCTGTDNFSNILTGADTEYSDSNVVGGNCYKYRYIVFDNAGNSSIYSSSEEIEIEANVTPNSSSSSTITNSSSSFTSTSISTSSQTTSSESSSSSELPLLDSDGDQLPDSWEVENGLNPNDSIDAVLDNDGDELTNIEEYQNSTDPNDTDSDDDGMQDNWEVENGLDPLDFTDASEDADVDGYTNLEECISNTDPNDSDSAPQSSSSSSSNINNLPNTGGDLISNPIAETVQKFIENIFIENSPSLEKFIDQLPSTGNRNLDENIKTTIKVGLPTIKITSATIIFGTAFAAANGTNLFGSPNLLLVGIPPIFRRRKDKQIGIVYDAESNVPIPFAVIRVYDYVTKNQVLQRVSDLKGRYSFVLSTGNYTIIVVHEDYDKFESQINIKNEELSINLDVSMYKKTQSKNTIRRAWQNIKSFIREKSGSILTLLFFIGFPVSIASVIFNPSVYNIANLTFYALINLMYLYYYISQPRNWGYIYDANSGRRIGNAFVRLFNTKDKKLIDTQMTDAKGRYGFIVDPGEYLLLVNAKGYKFPSVKTSHEDLEKTFYGSLFKLQINKTKISNFAVPLDKNISMPGVQTKTMLFASPFH